MSDVGRDCTLHACTAVQSRGEDASATGSHRLVPQQLVQDYVAERVRQEQRRVELLDAGQCRGGSPS